MQKRPIRRPHTGLCTIGTRRSNHASVRRFLVAVAIAAWTSACAAAPQTSSLAPPKPAKNRSSQGVLIQRVVIAEPRLSAPDVLEEALTLNLVQLVSSAGYFGEVKVVPDKLPDGYRMRLRFDRYEVTRRLHPIYLPAAFITATVYIWLNGPIFRDEVDLKATLTIESPDGRTLISKTEERNETENIGFYSPKRGMGLRDGGEDRTELIQSLLESTLAQLQSQGGLS